MSLKSHIRSQSGSSTSSDNATTPNSTTTSSNNSSNTSSPNTSATTSPTIAGHHHHHGVNKHLNVHSTHHQKSNSSGSIPTSLQNKHLGGALLQQQQQFNSSLDDLKHQLEVTTIIDLELVDGEVIINEDYDSYDDYEDYEEEEEEEEEEEDNHEQPHQHLSMDSHNRSTDSLPEEEELSITSNSSSHNSPNGLKSLPSIRPSSVHEQVNIVKRAYSHTVSGYTPPPLILPPGMENNNRLERSESIVYHGESNSHEFPPSPIGHRGGNNERVFQTKDKISSDYKKMLEDPEAFKNEKLKQRKSKYFSKKDLEELPFTPSSGTLLRSNIYKQFMSEKIEDISQNPEKYKSELLKSYINNLKLNTPKDELTAKKKNKVNRNRSQSTPPVNLSNNNKLYIGTLESIIEKENKRDNTIRKLPLLISKCIEFLSNETALSTEGLFRVGGNAGDVENLLKALLLYGTPIPDNTCVHVVSNTIKKFLRQLSVPLFTFNLHNNFIQITKLSNDQEKIESLKQLLKQIPSPNQLLIQELSKFLIKVGDYSSKNMMHAYNLGLMFGPNVMRPSEENEFNTMSTMLDSQSQIWTLILENYNSIYS